MSYVLRHKPEELGLTLEKGGWTSLDTLMEGMVARGYVVDLAVIQDVVDTSEKKRFAISEDGTKIRANQGHSTKVDLELKKEIPPFELYHGTVAKAIADIKKDGLQKMNRHHVHLSPDKQTAITVGSRRGVPIILQIKARAMNTDGFEFYKSENGVWLTDHVPPSYIIFS